MTDIIEIQTQRLLLRQWRLTDFELFAAINANQSVMKFYPNTLSKQQSDEFAKIIEQRITANGFGFWAGDMQLRPHNPHCCWIQSVRIFGDCSFYVGFKCSVNKTYGATQNGQFSVFF